MDVYDIIIYDKLNHHNNKHVGLRTYQVNTG